MAKQENKVREKPCVVHNDNGQLETECCRQAPVFFKNGRSLCSGCWCSVERGAFGWRNSPEYASLSNLDTEVKRMTGPKELTQPRVGMQKKRTLKPIEGQLGLLD